MKIKEFLCPQCGKRHGWDTNNVITSNYCSNCIESWAKSPPKKQNRVFNFEIIVTRGESKNTMARENLGGGIYAHHPNDGFINTFGGYTVKGNTQVDFDGLLAPDWMEMGKSYVVEIKEKSEKA